MNIQDTLNERGKRYGEFPDHAYLSQQLKGLLYKAHGANPKRVMEPFHWEALDMICHKIARIINGDPNYDDSWRDIAGYAQLVVNELNREVPAD